MTKTQKKIFKILKKYIKKNKHVNMTIPGALANLNITGVVAAYSDSDKRVLKRVRKSIKSK